ncbi:MAG: MFS transporter [Reyranella sp.]|uniref:MFS transporter n=1 Tax=Reyranella sp. TaxID=1929291 RepID=UPI001ACEDC24|nr:MFS transporter [Reyranella sp.]MBN9086314.1 MFS transporter [Reyranella sp.]
MSASSPSALLPWYKEPTKDQWYAYSASWLGWTLDAFDFTVFLFIIGPIADEFKVPVTEVTIVFTLTLWMRLLGATAAGWLGDRIGRRWPLMISILWYSFCNFIAGFSPTFMFLLVFRTLLGIGMGAEWPAGASLAMESWPTRSRGLMSGILQGSWGLGYALAAGANWLLFADFGWRGLLWIGILPALAVLYIRFFVKEPEVWAENKRQQTAEHTEVTLPLFTIFKRKYIWNTLTGCFWMASAFCVYYSIWALFPTYLQRELHWTPAQVFVPIFFANIIVFGGSALWGFVSDKWGRRPGIYIPAIIGIFITPLYLHTTDPTWVVGGFILQGLFLGSIYGQNPSYLCERFPTEVRATASGFVYHQGAIFGGVIAPLLSYFANEMKMGYAWPMMVSTMGFAILVVIFVLLGPETKGKELTSKLEVFQPAE